MKSSELSSHEQWIRENYSQLQYDYGGNWVLIKDGKVYFADKNFELVYRKAEELFPNRDCVIEQIDSGDGAIHAIYL